MRESFLTDEQKAERRREVVRKWRESLPPAEPKASRASMSEGDLLAWNARPIAQLSDVARATMGLPPLRIEAAE